MFQPLALKAPLGLCAIRLLLLQFLLPWLASCSGRPCTPECYKSLQLTRESLDHFSSHLASGFTDPLVVELQAHLATWRSYWRLCMKYLIGSAAVLGRVDGRALGVIYGLCRVGRIEYLSDLLDELTGKNDSETVAQFIAQNTGKYPWCVLFGNVVAGLIKDDWDVVCRLINRVLAILKKSRPQCSEYYGLLRCLPIGLQHKKIHAGKVPLDDIGKIYLLDQPFDPVLREIFFLTRRSSASNPAIRERIAERAPYFKQFMPDGVPSKAMAPCAGSSANPSHYIWEVVLEFLDTETLIFVWPLVCRSWSRAHSRTLANAAMVHKHYLEDLSHVKWRKVHTIAPWSHFLNETNSAAYLGQCIISGALGRAKLDHNSVSEIKKYIWDAVSGRARIPKAGKESTLYDSFLKLIEEASRIYPFATLAFARPPFFSDEKYEKAVHHLTYRKRLIMQLPNTWIVSNPLRLYSVVGKDERLLVELLCHNLRTLERVCVFLIMLGQAGGISECLARSVFSLRKPLMKKFIEPKLIPPNEYYKFMVESDMLFEMEKNCHETVEIDQTTLSHYETAEFSYLFLSIILYFKEDSDKIGQIEASTISQLSNLDEGAIVHKRRRLGAGSLRILESSDKYSPEDVEFVKRVLMKCGLLEELKGQSGQ